MTEVRYGITEGKGGCERRYLLCEGHSTGSRDACTAVSAIAYTLACYLKNHEETAWSDIMMDEGYAEFTIDTRDQKVMGAWEMAVIGLKQLQHSFGDYIHVAQIK